MKLQGISIDIVRNEYEYNKYVSAEYRKKYSFEESKPSLPWIIIHFAKQNAPEDFTSASVLTMIPAADFTNISAASNNEWSVGSDKAELNVNLEKIPNTLMLEAKKDCGFSSLPNNLIVMVEDNLKDKYLANKRTIDLSDKASLLKAIDEECLQQGQGLLANIIYELIAQDKV